MATLAHRPRKTSHLPPKAPDASPKAPEPAPFALLNTTTTSAGSLIVLDVRSRPRANAFLTDVAAARYGYYHGVPLLDQPSGTVLAFVGHYLVLGQAAGVQSAIDAAKGRTP